jgi:hypothetical protein
MTRSFDRVKNYVVIKHKLSGINGLLCGVKFREGYGVVELNSKLYIQLMSLPLIKGQPTYPLSHLKKLPFVTRSQDIQVIYGVDIYRQYMEQIKPIIEQEQIEYKEKEEIKHTEVELRCSSTNNRDSLCRRDAVPFSKAGLCKLHILEEPGLAELGIKIPLRMTNTEKFQLRQKVCDKLESLPKNPRTKKEVITVGE